MFLFEIFAEYIHQAVDFCGFFCSGRSRIVSPRSHAGRTTELMRGHTFALEAAQLLGLHGVNG